MILSKVIRHRLFAGEVVEIPLAKLGNVRQDGVYAIATQKGKRQGQFRVLLLRANKAVIRYEGDPVRLLAKDGGGGDSDGRPYTSFEGRAVREEPEAVDEMTQKRFTKEAGERAMERRGDEQLRREQRSIEARIGIAQKVAAIKGVDISGDLRAMERRLLAIERKLDERIAA